MEKLFKLKNGNSVLLSTVLSISCFKNSAGNFVVTFVTAENKYNNIYFSDSYSAHKYKNFLATKVSNFRIGKLKRLLFFLSKRAQ